MKLEFGRTGFCMIPLAAMLACGVAQGQNYPSKPIRLIVAGSPAGGADILARPLANKLSESFGNQVIVENRAGGGGIPAAQAFLSTAPDGYTLFVANSVNMSISPALRAKLPYDPVKDFAPVTLFASAALMIAVHPSLPVKSMREMLALAKAKPKQILCASNGEGTIQHLTIEMLNRAAGVSLLHVPYKGGTPAVVETMGGQTQMIITAVPTLLTQVKAARLRALAITSGQRLLSLPDIPTVAESGFPGFESVQWYGIFAHLKTPVSVIERWSAEVRMAAESPAVKAGITREGAQSAVNGPQALAEFLRADIAKWRKVVKEANIVLE